MARLLHADLDEGAYRDTLERMWGYYSPLEAVLCPPATVGYSFGPRAPRLAADLEHLGGRPVHTLPCCAHLPRVDTEARAWGCLYVLEGAALGGRVIFKQVARSVGVSADRGGSFFAGEAPTGEGWKAFTAALEASTPPDAHESVVAAAVETFETLQRWLQV